MLVIATSSHRLFGEVLPWLFVLAGIVVVGGIIVYAFRRLMTDQSSGSGQGFTLHDLRELHRTGELSDEQYERAREKMIGRVVEPHNGEDSETQTGHEGGKST